MHIDQHISKNTAKHKYVGDDTDLMKLQLRGKINLSPALSVVALLEAV